jgi:hypothetical protein
MKITLRSLASATLLLLTAVLPCAAVEQAPTPKPATTAEFERMKSLIGTWKGTTDMGQGPVELTVEYRLLAAGSVLEERILPGTPNEMITMYYEKEGKLALTHYCMLGNRPEMRMKSADAKSISFDFDSCCAIDPKKESHMHAMTVRFDDANTITTSCKAVMEGKDMAEHSTTLKRVSVAAR